MCHSAVIVSNLEYTQDSNARVHSNRRKTHRERLRRHESMYRLNLRALNINTNDKKAKPEAKLNETNPLDEKRQTLKYDSLCDWTYGHQMSSTFRLICLMDLYGISISQSPIHIICIITGILH